MSRTGMLSTGSIATMAQPCFTPTVGASGLARRSRFSTGHREPVVFFLQATFAECDGQLRRVMLTRVGPARFRAELPESVVDTDLEDRGMVRRLLNLKDPRTAGLRFCICPSTRTFYAAQPAFPQVRICAAAIACRLSALDVTVFGQLSTQVDYAPAIEEWQVDYLLFCYRTAQVPHLREAGGDGRPVAECTLRPSRCRPVPEVQ